MIKSENISIVWFRRDLRLEDNPALSEATKQGSILPIFILNDKTKRDLIGQASAIWLHHSLKSLNDSLNGKLNIYIGNPSQIIEDLITRHKVENVFWNISYEPTLIKEAQEVSQICDKTKVKCKSFNGNYLWHPKQILKDDKGYYKVFTAYRNKVLSLQDEFVLCKNKELRIITDSL
jgi:deoxyribodipyrimidine photo-lyase